MDIGETTMPQALLSSSQPKTSGNGDGGMVPNNSSSKLKENARRTLKLSIPKLQMAEQRMVADQSRAPRIVTGNDTVITGEKDPMVMNRNDAISAMFLNATNATTPPQSAKTVSPSSGMSRSPNINHFLDNAANKKQFQRFLSFSPNATFSHSGLANDLVSSDGIWGNLFG